MKNNLYTAVIVNLITLLSFVALPLQASKKKFIKDVAALELAEEKDLAKQALTLFRDYYSYEKELVINCYMPENIKQEIMKKIQQKQDELSTLFSTNNNNTCFINKMMQTMKALELHLLNEKIKTVEVLIAEINKQ